MKTRMRRFWISVSLVGSLALPLSGTLRAHDLPTRWTSGANSTPSWNHLLDDCLDTPSLAGPESLAAVDMTTRRAPEDWASSCPAEIAAGVLATGNEPAAHARVNDHDHLWRNPISRFSKEMTCWVNEWQQQQYGDVASTPAIAPAATPYAWAARPSAGDPPTPDWNAFIRSNVQALNDQALSDQALSEEPLNDQAEVTAVSQSDTCAFDAEYQARQTAADLLAAEIQRAVEIARNEQQLSQALADAARLQASSDADAIPTVAEVAQSAAFDNYASTLCGGESSEIISTNCVPNRFAPGIVDEYMAYDLDARDQHWLGGLGKAWKLRSALSNSRATQLVDNADVLNDVWAIPTEEPALAPESFVAPDLTNMPEAVASNPIDLAGMNQYLDRIVLGAQRSALAMLEDARQSARPAVEVAPTVLPTLLPNITESLASASEWVETQQCALAAELCGFEHVYAMGQWLGDHAIESTHVGFTSLVAMGHYLDVPAVDANEPGLDVYVIYIDADGTRIAVPSSMARAWNRPERESDEPASTSTWTFIDSVQTQVVTRVAKQLDSIGMTCLQVADSLNSWAQTEIASREGADVR